MVLNWVSLLTVVGLSQGVLLAAVLASLSSGNLRANRFLAGFVAVLTVSLGVFFLVYTPIETPYPFVFFRLATIHFWTGPLLYFYILLLVNPRYRFSWRDGMHVLPFPMAFASTYLMAGPEAFQHLPYEQLPHSLKFDVALRSVLGDFLLLVYSFASLRLLKRHRLQIEQQFSSLEKITLQWLKLFVCLCLAMAALSIVVELTGLIASLYLAQARIVAVITRVLLLYGIGFLGLRQPLIFDVGGTPAESAKEQPASDDSVNDEMIEAEKYQRSGLSPEDVQSYWAKLQAHIESQHSYRTAGLKVGHLARELGMRDNYLSQVINSCAGKNFFEFINGYRLEEAKQLLRDEPQKPISEIALDVGFASQNAFNNHFKKHQQLTPSAYRKKSIENNNL